MTTILNARDKVQSADGRRGILLYFVYEKGRPSAAVVQVNPVIIQHADKHRRHAGEVTIGGQLATIPLADLALMPDDGATLFEPAGCIGSA